jgi:hypothetical protein
LRWSGGFNVNLAGDLKEFIELLNSEQVEYIIVGAFALGLHKLPRYTGDIDLLVSNSPPNAQCLALATDKFGFGSPGLKAIDFEGDDTIIQLGMPPNRIDLITNISGVSFAEAWANKEKGILDRIPVYFLSLMDLIRNKRRPVVPRILSMSK